MYFPNTGMYSEYTFAFVYSEYATPAVVAVAAVTAAAVTANGGGRHLSPG
jgi:hypothetical protein